MHRLVLLLVLLLAAHCASCGSLVGSSSAGTDYSLTPEEFVEDFGAGAMMAFPSVDCSKDAMACQAIPSLPMAAAASCDTGSGKCIATYAAHLLQSVSLSQEPGFPSPAAGMASLVTVLAVHYWAVLPAMPAPPSPALKVYVGPQTAQKETDAGVTLLGTMPALSPTGKTNCHAGGAAGTQGSSCDLPLSPDGSTALAAFGKDYRTAFSLLVTTSLVVHAGETLPSGSLHFFLQPALEYTVYR